MPAVAECHSVVEEHYAEILFTRLQAGEVHRLRLRRRARQGASGSAGEEWRELNLRPVLIRGLRHWQFVYAYPQRDQTENLLVEEALLRLQEHLRLPLRSLLWEEASERCVVQFSRKGRPQLRREAHVAPLPPLSLAHDRSPAAPLPAERPDPFLRAIGVMTAEGRIRARQRAKFQQINEFLQQLAHAGAAEIQPSAAGRPLSLIDCGCGSALLSFAALHYLSVKCGRPSQLVGIDQDAGLIEKARQRSEQLQQAGVMREAAAFHAGAIRDFRPEEAPDILLALHACDTATDEAIALGIREGVSLLLVAPCCHQHLQAQLPAVAPFAPLQRHGILQQRLGDLLTDALRALALEIMGYRCSVVQFVGGEHTDRNVMLRARRREREDARVLRRAVDEYGQLTRYWGVKPQIETLLGESFAERLAVAGQRR